MKTYILVDENKIVRCVASEECNLHTDKLYMNKHHVDLKGTVGDEYDQVSNTWISHPENYPQPTEDEINEKKIKSEMILIQRAEAIQSLKDKGELPIDHKE